MYTLLIVMKKYAVRVLAIREYGQSEGMAYIYALGGCCNWPVHLGPSLVGI